MRLALVLTHQCDLACAYCYTGRKFARRMPRAIGRRAIERALAGLAPGEPLDLCLFGGEPLLEWDLGRELLVYARDRAALAGVRVRALVTTNGTHLDERILDQALKLGVQLAISMDGLPADHDRFRPRRGGQPSSDAALAAIDALVARRAAFSTVSVVRPETVERLGAGARFLADRGVRDLRHGLDHDATWTPADGGRLRAALADLREVYVERAPDLSIAWLEAKAALLTTPQLARPSCGVGQGEVAVAPSGRVYPCERLVGEDADPESPLVFDHVDAASGPFAGFGRSAQPGEGSACDGCGTRSTCQNDCACTNLSRSGALDGPDGLVCLVQQTLLAEAETALLALAARAGAHVVDRVEDEVLHG